MTIEILKQATTLYSKIQSIQARLSQFQDMADEAKDTTVRTRIRGIDIDLPKALFKTEVLKKRNALESELSALQAEFDAL